MLEEKNTNSIDYNKLGNAVAKAIDKSNKKTVSVSTEHENASTIRVKMDIDLNKRRDHQKDYAAKIRNDLQNHVNCRMFAIPTIYKQYQPSFVVTINGCTIHVKTDGKMKLLHNDYIRLIERRMRALDYKVEHANTENTRELDQN